MNKYKQCMYTVILILTCLVASPFIYKQIWETSSLKQAKAAKKEPNVISSITTAATTAAASDTAETTAAEEEETTEPTTEEKPVFTESDPSYFDDALFIGDSRTVGIKEYGTLKNADYFCSVGLSAYKINSEYVDGYSLTDKLSSKKYGKIYIMLGINEVANDTEYTVSSFRALIETVRGYQPDAIIYIEGNLHVSMAGQTDSINNEGINALNDKLREMCEADSNAYYIDINEVFDDETGSLTAEFTSDGVHVLGKYYETWCDWLCANTVADGSSSEEQTTEKSETTEPATAEETSAESYDYQYQESYDNGGYSDSYDNSYEQY